MKDYVEFMGLRVYFREWPFLERKAYFVSKVKAPDGTERLSVARIVNLRGGVLEGEGEHRE